MNLTQTFQDEYNTPFTRSNINGDSIFTEGKITVVGYNERTDTVSNERKYTSRLVKLNIDGTVAQNLEIKPKIGNSTWFATKSMDSVNIDRRCYVNGVSVSKSKIYLSYYGTQGGTSFRQCITPTGNLIEPYRQYFSVYESNYTMQNILGTDRYVAVYSRGSSNTYFFMIVNALTSRPIGTHTRLAQAAEKTETNTMKAQYLFEIDLPIYGEDYY